MSSVGIVCDSTCDLPPDWLAEEGVRMVPLKVLFEDESYLDWVELDTERFFELLSSSAVLPKTSQPSPADFAEAYAEMAEDGHTEIVSVHLSAALSGTLESATMAAAESPVPVRLVDTKLVSQATALAVKAAIRARDEGGTADVVERAARAASESCRLLFILDTLDYLVKGGRAGKASGLAAAVLNIKPVLTFTPEGTIEPFKKVKGLKKAINEVAMQVAADTQDSPALLTILHSCAPELAETMRDALDAAGAKYQLDSVGEIGAVIGTYSGPGAVGVAYHPQR